MFHPNYHWKQAQCEAFVDDGEVDMLMRLPRNALPHHYAAVPMASYQMAAGQNPVPLVNIKIGGKWMFIHPFWEP